MKEFPSLPVTMVIVAATLTACSIQASKAPPEAPPAASADAAEGPIPSVLEEIYGEIDGAVLAYRDALDLLESGSAEAGENLLEDALAGLDDTTNRCRAIAGCDLGRAVNAYQEVIGAQARVFEGEGGAQGVGAELASDAAAERIDQAAVVTPDPESIRFLQGRDLADLIPMNRYVQEALNDWLTWNRPQIMRTYENYQYLRPEMAPVYENAGFPEALLFGMLTVESAGRVHAYSRVGAAGPLQFMRGTGRRYGLTTENGFDQRLDPELAARANVAYLQEQLGDLDNSLEKALAAYNAGENRLKRLNRSLRNADFWTSDFFYRLPRDTRKYVPEVMAAAWLFMHADQYNLVFPSYENQRTELVLEMDLSLGELAICLGNDDQRDGWFRTLRNLNPAVKPGDRIPAGDSIVMPTRVVATYQERCAPGTLVAEAAALHDASYNDEDELLPYVIRQGDTLGTIARRHRCMSTRELAAINGIKPPRYLIRAGKTIKVPNC